MNNKKCIESILKYQNQNQYESLIIISLNLWKNAYITFISSNQNIINWKSYDSLSQKYKIRWELNDFIRVNMNIKYNFNQVNRTKLFLVQQFIYIQ